MKQMKCKKSRIQKTVGIIGAAVDKGQQKEGVQKGADLLRNRGLLDILNLQDMIIIDYGNLKQPQLGDSTRILNCGHGSTFVRTSNEIANTVETSVAENNLTLVLGGDHSLAYGSVWGHFRVFPNSFVVWVDAHADFNTPNVSKTGNMHGMPVAFLLEETNKLIPKSNCFNLLPPVLNSTNLIYIGLRDVDTAEWEYIKEFNIRYFTMEDIRRLGIKKVMKLTLKAISKQNNCYIHLSFDIDALDPSIAPSTGTPVSGGLTLDEGKHICKSLANTGMLKSVDIAEVNPEIGSTSNVESTLSAALQLLASCI